PSAALGEQRLQAMDHGDRPDPRRRLMPDTADAMLHMTRDELDDLFRSSPTGPIPKGEARGTVISHPGTEFAEIAAKLVHLIAWQGKIFDPEKGELLNEISPLHLDRIRAK